jgi:dipeptidase D
MQPTLERVLRLFAEISAIPRCSKHEAQVIAWLQAWAQGRGLDAQTDAIGNLVIRVPAAPGHEAAPTVILQGHVDMVCQKTDSSPHDFSRDPIRLVRDGDWLHADGTTLGADNGIGVSIALAVAEAASAPEGASFPHPALELLLTVDEEVGLGGARGLDPALLQGRRLINLDSEGDGKFVVGCAGGAAGELAATWPTESAPAGFRPYRLEITGLSGGHSGADIDKGRVSANRALAELLPQVAAAADVRLFALNGGTVRNAIARQAEAGLWLDPAAVAAVQAVLADFAAALNQAHANTDTPAQITLTAADGGPALSAADTGRVVRLLAALPHGIEAMSPTIPGLVETSANLAILKLADGVLEIVTSQRSSDPAGLEAVNAKVAAAGAAAEAAVAFRDAYPGWQPETETPLFQLCLQTYREFAGKEPEILVIHAGLECGVIGARLPGMQMISMGASLVGAHSPDERVSLPSTEATLGFLLELLGRLA